MRSAFLLALLVPACAPTRAELFDPVREAVIARVGLEPGWRPTWQRPAAAQERIHALLAAPLTPDSVALLAVLNSSALQALYEDLAVAGASVTASRTPANPEVEARLHFPLSGGNPDIELSAIQDLTGLLALIPRSNVAAADLRATRRDLVSRAIDLAARAKVLLYDAAAAAERLALRRTIAEAATAAAELARKLHEAGNITDLALLRDTLFEEDARIALRGAEADAQAARQALNAVLGVSGDETQWQLAPRLLEAPAPPSDVANLEREAVAASLDLDAARARLEAAGGRVALARLESFVPHLGAGISAAREESEGWHAGPAVSLSLPLFDWGQGKRAAAWADVRRQQHSYAAVAVELRATAGTVAERLRTAEDQLARIRERLLPLREQLLDESVKQYNAMTLGPFELLQVRREQIAIEERYIEALRSAWIARIAAWQLRAGSRPTIILNAVDGGSSAAGPDLGSASH